MSKLVGIVKQFIKKLYFNFYRKVIGVDKKRLALGETISAYKFPNWVLLDVREADINIDVETPPINIGLSDVHYCYSSHMFEHITDNAALNLLKQVYRTMAHGGVIRLEMPDADKILNDYRSGELAIAKYNADHNMKSLVEEYGYSEDYGAIHIGTLSLVSCVYKSITKSEGLHVPKLVSKEHFEAKLSDLNNDDFCEWAIGLQTQEEKLQHGHINYWTETKLGNLLRKAGFSDPIKCNAGFTHYDFDLKIERPHRAFYSLILEARVLK